mmetsp:Transcript_68873/g.174994  ORF Transcript_68873/g.174994 Transcript_68873/m.174994 type:complete len:134 (+) Transcript_68873:356-757(+)
MGRSLLRSGTLLRSGKDAMADFEFQFPRSQLDVGTDAFHRLIEGLKKARHSSQAQSGVADKVLAGFSEREREGITCFLASMRESGVRDTYRFRISSAVKTLRLLSPAFRGISERGSWGHTHCRRLVLRCCCCC